MKRTRWLTFALAASGVAIAAARPCLALDWPLKFHVIRPAGDTVSRETRAKEPTEAAPKPAIIPYEEDRPEKSGLKPQPEKLETPRVPVMEERPAAPEGPLSLQTLRDLAMRCNPTLSQARAVVRRAQGQVVQSGLYPNPSAGYAASEIGNEGHGGQQGYFIEQEFVTAHKLALSRNVNSQERQRSLYGLQAQYLRVMNAVRREYYAVLVAKSREELSVELVEVTALNVKVTEARLKREEGTRIEVLQAKIQNETAYQTLIAAENAHRAAWKRLEAVVGCPFAGNSLDGDPTVGIPDLLWDDVWERIRTTSPQLSAARTNVRKAQARVARAKVEPIPNVIAQGIHNYDMHTQYHIAGAQIGVAIPVFNRNQGNIASAEADVIHACREVQRLERVLARNLANAFRDYSTALAQAERYRTKILPAAKETLEASRALYEAGEVGYLQLQIAQQTFTQTNLQYMAVLGELWNNIVAIEGMLLIDGLASPESFDPDAP